MDVTKYIKGVVVLMGTALLSLVLYQILYGVGNWEGMLMWSADKMEKPIGQFYEEFAVRPSVEVDSNGKDLFDSSKSDYNTYKVESK